jgi:hypothetical protein
VIASVEDARADSSRYNVDLYLLYNTRCVLTRVMDRMVNSVYA